VLVNYAILPKVRHHSKGEAWDPEPMTPRITSSLRSILCHPLSSCAVPRHPPLNALVEIPADSESRIGQAVEDFWTSDPFYPSPWMNPKADGWEDAYEQAKSFVSQLTLLEKVNLTTGVG
jgi:hypothetical protein